MRDKKLKTSQQAADELGIHPGTLWRWQQDGKIEPSWKTPGGQARWNLDHLRKQLNLPVEDQPIVLAIVTCERGVLVGKRRDGKPPWTFIGGEVEPMETPEEAAVREVAEEAELRVIASAAGPIGQRVHPKTGRTMIYVPCAPVSSTEVVVGDAEELEEVRWISEAEAEDLLPGLWEPVLVYLASVLRDDDAEAAVTTSKG